MKLPPVATFNFDTSPLIFLDALHYLDTLANTEVFTAPAVRQELTIKEGAFGAHAPALSWVIERAPSEASLARVRAEVSLDAGESEALALAVDLGCMVATDDLAARRYAKRKGISLIGTVGLLIAIHENGYAVRSLEEDIAMLQRAGLFLSDDPVRKVLSH